METSAASPSDALLISRIVKGEKQLFEFIIRRYNQQLYRVGMSVLSDEAATEEAMQAAYVKAYEHLAQFEQRSAFSTWLIRIMLNECLAQKQRSSRLAAAPARQLQNQSAMTPSDIMMNKELTAVLESAIARLPEKYRLVFVLREIEELSVKETGQVLGIAQPNVKVRLNRAKTMLRTHLSGYMRSHVYAFHLSRCDRMASSTMRRIDML